MIYSGLKLVILFEVQHWRRQRDDGLMGCSGAWLAVREGLGLHYKEVGDK